ncbi:MAG: histidinol dehydrogenase [Actinobacteria bacterium]|nr:histidinol dehydrogenase [Actinomycetota bacterium]
MIIRPLSLASLASEIAGLRPSAAATAEIASVVSELIEQVRTRGDAAVVEATALFDWSGAEVSNVVVPPGLLQVALEDEDPELLDALRTTRDNCTFFHRHEFAPDWEDIGPQGQILGIRRVPVERAGLYVPGGLGSYASTVIMNAVPARVAGVEELIICTPPGSDGSVNSSVLAAAELMGVERVFRVGGAQAIAAMAYGTETIPRVDVICGPGNVYVMEAKRQLYGTVGIDSLAGPSEVLVIADHSAQPDWVAADLLAQEEHGSGAQAVLVAESRSLCLQVEEAIDRLAASAPVRDRVAAATGDSGEPARSDRLWAFFPEAGMHFIDLAVAVANSYASEHLELQVADPRSLLPRIRSAGAVFLGHHSPTAFGDYIAGSNHVLPTGGSARFASPLSVEVFLRKSSYLEMRPEALQALTPRLVRLADSEGFYFHRVSAEVRLTDVR